MESHKQIEKSAADWIVRRDREDWSPADEEQFRTWLNFSMAHRAAYLRLEAAWEHTLRLQALGAGVRQGVIPASGAWRVSPFFKQRGQETETQARWRSSKFMSVAAGVLLLLGISAYLLAVLGGERYTTATGVMTSVPLEDGSSMLLNTKSRIHVVMNQHQRLIKLDDGEVFFDVATDPLRPFVVEAGKRRIKAIGTRFSVRRNGNDVQVVVTQGRVQIDAIDTTLAAGAIARAAGEKISVEEKSPQEAEEALSWRTGYLTFKALPLREAVAEFNRYNMRQIVIEDELATFHVTGRFRATNADAFLRVLHQGFGIDARTAGDTIVLTAGGKHREQGVSPAPSS